MSGTAEDRREDGVEFTDEGDLVTARDIETGIASSGESKAEALAMLAEALGLHEVGPMRARRSELKTLSDVIGYEYDLAEFATTMHDKALFGDDTRAVLAPIIGGRRAELHREGRPLGERLFAEEPDRLVARFGQYWEATSEYDT